MSKSYNQNGIMEDLFMVMEQHMVFEDCVLVEHKVIGFASNYNALCEIDLVNSKLKYLSSIPTEKFCEKRLVSKIVPYKGKLFLLPMGAKKINVYDIAKDLWYDIDIPLVQVEYNPYHKFLEAVVDNGYLYVIGAAYPGILKIDLETSNVVKNIQCYTEFSCQNVEGVWVRTGYVKVHNNIFLASCVSNEVMKFNLETLSCKVISVGSVKNRYSGIVQDKEGFFWLSPMFNSNIVKWDTKLNCVEEFSIENCDKEGYFIGVVVDSENRKIFPRMQKGNTIIIDELDVITELNERYYMYKKLDDDTICSENDMGELCVVKARKDKRRIGKMVFSDNFTLLNCVQREALSIPSDCCFFEDSNLFNLKNFLDII